MRFRCTLFAACLLAVLPHPASAAPVLAFEEQAVLVRFELDRPVHLARLRTLGAGAGPPERFDPKDLVFAIDLDRMEILAERIPAPAQP